MAIYNYIMVVPFAEETRLLHKMTDDQYSKMNHVL